MYPCLSSLLGSRLSLRIKHLNEEQDQPPRTIEEHNNSTKTSRSDYSFFSVNYLIPGEELFSETVVMYTAEYFVKIIWCSLGFVTPSSSFEAVYCLFAVAEGFLLLDLWWFVLFLIFLKTRDVYITGLPILILHQIKLINLMK